MTGPATPGPSIHVHGVNISGTTGWPGPKTNHQMITTAAQTSIMGQYDALQNTHVVRGKPWIQRGTPSARDVPIAVQFCATAAVS